MNIKALSLPILIGSLILTACNKDANAEKGNLTASAPAGEASTLTEHNTVQRLKTTLSNHFKTANIAVTIEDIQAVPNSNFYWVRLNNHSSVFTTADGQFIIQGDVLRLGNKNLEDVSEQFQSQINQKALASLQEQDLIIFPATAKKQHTIYVFTDVSCPYCHRLHQQVADMNAKGIEVRYVAWPRGEQFYPAMHNVWCSADRKQALDDAMQGKEVAEADASCKSPVQASFELGQQMGVTGTPAVFTEDGRQIGGYLTADEVVKALK